MTVQNGAASKLVILIFVTTYLPGYKGGGPVRSISNMVEALGDEFQFLVVTADRDAGDDEPYEIARGTQGWVSVGKAKVLYLPPAGRRLSDIRAVLRATPHDVLYLNSFFSTDFTTKPLVARRLLGHRHRPCVVAPRGEFSAGALALKQWKKLPFIAITRAARLYEGVTWEASAEYDATDIRSTIGAHPDDIRIATDIPAPPADLAGGDKEHLPRRPGDPLRICFVSRITPMKNLDFALEVLKSVPIPVRFQIYGPIRDHSYHQQCQRLIRDLPAHVDVAFMGGVSHEDVRAVFASSDLFFFPTRGENFGHVIAESLAAGTPVLTSDRTPWRNLAAAGVGWDLPLGEGISIFRDKILEADVRSRTDGSTWRRIVQAHAVDEIQYRDRIQAVRRLFLF